ncbi:hypothetical protein VFPPC_18391 [Pochonia chlamydosporia 170]|uniref:Methyltransferase domain-containing protein n=1 Tax=Pochonia chlamydosporia 170 TaxID=1380566 RepID=A0A219AQ87_METCM|nr:hypothetical protein VFPPC_18391 [Pochonia chlamydosporia 170]OWT42494.1 hypothetical protein VFPPC_18391 [Pochonia chlamydosporia 170]
MVQSHFLVDCLTRPVRDTALQHIRSHHSRSVIAMPGNNHENNAPLSDGAQYPAQLFCGRWYGTNDRFQRDKYLFPIDEEELNRLDLFHHVFHLACNNTFFLSPLDKTQPLRILDLGTGTGIWPIMLSDLPSFFGSWPRHEYDSAEHDSRNNDATKTV